MNPFLSSCHVLLELLQLSLVVIGGGDCLFELALTTYNFILHLVYLVLSYQKLVFNLICFLILPSQLRVNICLLLS